MKKVIKKQLKNWDRNLNLLERELKLRQDSKPLDSSRLQEKVSSLRQEVLRHQKIPLK